MTKIETSETELKVLYGKDDCLKAVIVQGHLCYFIDFYLDDVIIDSRKIEGHTLRYAEDLAENYVNGIIRVDKDNWRLHSV